MILTKPLLLHEYAFSSFTLHDVFNQILLVERKYVCKTFQDVHEKNENSQLLFGRPLKKFSNVLRNISLYRK